MKDKNLKSNAISIITKDDATPLIILVADALLSLRKMSLNELKSALF